MLRPVRLHQTLSRTVHTITLPQPDGGSATWAVETRTADDHEARLYRDGQRITTAEMPAAFTVPGGRIEVDAGFYGVTRVHLVAPDGQERRLAPAPGTLEYRRAALTRRHPRLSRGIAATAVVILLANLVLAVPEGLELLTSIPQVAGRFGTFTSPVDLPGWLSMTLMAAGIAAAVERAVTWRHNRIVDAETTWTSF
ncbi:hypothetical protein [Pseudonocardia sp. MH-G8]|uniref:hypothetical protein n=1 Tax=Pseudonocardia sp. MH-G8 TaxID=1854588 RepID=UPI000BA15886|nr:hypothetical protein [Pseudonocardia sp. MH-G8]OZM84120.1 hypothetical protein CFP66_06860 [Pseudonocardia sp. MH-G8]